MTTVNLITDCSPSWGRHKRREFAFYPFGFTALIDHCAGMKLYIEKMDNDFFV